MGETDQVSISGEGMDRLGDVGHGLRKLVWAIAESIAEERGLPAQIELEDVDRAASRIVDAIRREVSESHLPAGITPAIDQMDQTYTYQDSRRAEHATAT